MTGMVIGTGLLLLNALCGATPPPVEVVNLTCETLTNPLGVDVAEPRLGWVLESGIRGQKQTACQVLVASTSDLLENDKGDRWDSGKVASDQSIQVPYAGAPLASFQTCFWKVRVWDKDGNPSAWSEPAMWTMGVLKQDDWAGAQWIGMTPDANAHPLAGEFKAAQWIWDGAQCGDSTNAKVGTIYFRKEFDLANAPEKAFLLMAADNDARLYVNGERVDDCSSFQLADQFDIAKLLHAGKNVVSVSCENMGDGPNPAGLYALIHVDYAGSGAFSAVTDASWKVKADAMPGWIRPDFKEAGWTAAKALGGYGLAPWGETRMPDLRVLPARMLRREIEVNGPIKRASVYFSGLGLSELYLNGGKVGDSVLSPGCTEYNKRVFYVSHEVTNQIVPGKNALGVWLGNGRYYAPRLREPIATVSFEYPEALFLLRLEMEDGSIQTVVSDTQWKMTADGPIQANNEYDGETYDARMELPGWANVGFDDAKWTTATQVAAPNGAVSWERINPIRVVEHLEPVAITQPQPGMYVYDMGQNMVGWCKLRVNGPSGTTVKLRFAETIQDDGAIYLANIRGAKVTDLYTLKGGEDEVYEPRFTYHGFRYVELTGYPGEPTLDTLEGCVVHDGLTRAGSFACSNKVLNNIYHNIYWGVRGNYRSMPTDCPQRDERQGWLGDRSEESRGETYLFDLAALYSKWVGDMGDAQRADGSVSDVCPAYWPLYNDNVTWPSSFIIIPDMLYQQYADTRTIAAHYDGMKKWIAHLLTYEKDGIIPKDNYGDWCVPPERQDLIHSEDPARKTAGEFLATAYFVHDLELVAGYAKLLGREDDAVEYQKKAEAMKAAFNATFFNADEAKYANGTQTSCVLPLAFGLVPDGYREKVFARLVNKIEKETNGHIGTGLIGGQQLMRVLSDNGRPDLAYSMATMTDYPSWGYMIENNATTIWELWNGNTADPAMNSHNHVMLVGDLNIWFHEYLAGIQPDQPGFKTLTMKPYPAGDLTYARASCRTLYGTVYSAWKIEENAFHWRVTVPANTTAKLYVPATDPAAITESGNPANTAEGLTFTGMEDTWAVYDAVAGHYQFTSTTFTRPGAK